MKRVINTSGAVFLGLGSIIGTGIFVSVGLAIGISGYLIFPAILIAAFIALFNGLSSARLAATFPVSGGTYEYAYQTLNPRLGFTAGWTFFAAKTASAATAALGFSGYLGWVLGYQDKWIISLVAFLSVIAITALVSAGIKRSDIANRIIVGFTLFVLFIFSLTGILYSGNNGSVFSANSFSIDFNSYGIHGVFHAAAMMFVAFTGYGRIATLGEEVRNPSKTIPRAVVLTLLFTMFIYMIVTYAALGLADAETLSEAAIKQASTLYAASTFIPLNAVNYLVIIGGATAMLGVLLNLVLGISRVVLAAARRNDMPEIFSRINANNGSPVNSVWLTGSVIALICLFGDLYTTWSFSAFTVLLYYSITNLSAIRLTREQRKMPLIIPIVGFIGCLSLAFWVDPYIWITGIIFVFIGLAYQFTYQKLAPS